MTRGSASAARLLDALFESQMITIPAAAKLLGMTHRAASLNLAKLVNLGVLRELDTGRRKRLFLAPAVMDAIQPDATRP